ncbi:hypothetical protein M9H77_30782 [Catharanthus roseus]|uniref:Uncharacterized protein n=1 Tax=Catharanthus roseus TaxID=4058 RepID=A0ACB9ZZA2_CATRO|nr:hypothetical protein M9H77_30782 [Catharanthus roseus]
MGEKSTKVHELSQAQDVVDRKVIHHEKKNICTPVKEENSYTINPLSPQQFYEEQRKMREKERIENEIGKKSKSECECEKSVVSTKESEGKRKYSECLIENHESLKEEQVEEKQDEIEKSEKTKEELSLMIFEGDKREEMRESCCDIISPLNSLSSEEPNLFTNFINHFFDWFSPSVQKFEAQDLGNEGRVNIVLRIVCLYVTLVGNLMVNPFTCELALDVDHMLKCSSPRAYLEKQHLEFMRLLLCGKKMNSSFEVLKVHLCDLVKTKFANAVSKLTLKNFVEKHLVQIRGRVIFKRGVII